MSEDETQLKQDLLKVEIYEKGYDLENFSFYMDGIKENGIPKMMTISRWDWYRSVDIGGTEAAGSGLLGQDGEGEAIRKRKRLGHLVKTRRGVARRSAAAEDVVALGDAAGWHKLLQTTALLANHQDGPRQISGLHQWVSSHAFSSLRFTKKQGGYFSSSYAIFKVTTQPQEWAVYRRYNDFQWLRDTLNKQYPGICVRSSFLPLYLDSAHPQEVFHSQLLRLVSLQKNEVPWGNYVN